MKYNLLQLVQAVLSSMDSDEVTSITDTVESQQVAKVVRTAYFDLIQRAQLPEHYDLVQTTESGPSTPTVMTIPTAVVQLGSIRYFDESIFPAAWADVMFLPVDEFFRRMDQMTDTFPNVATYTYTADSGASFTITHRNDKQPQWYTVIGDNVLLFDSIDTGVEAFLRATKTRAQARMEVTWTEDDSFTPDLDEPQFNLLLAESKALAWAELKQAQHAKAEQSARRGWSQLQKSKNRSDELSDFEKLPSFGRKY